MTHPHFSRCQTSDKQQLTPDLSNPENLLIISRLKRKAWFVLKVRRHATKNDCTFASRSSPIHIYKYEWKQHPTVWRTHQNRYARNHWATGHHSARLCRSPKKHMAYRKKYKGVCQNSHPLLKYHKARTFTSSGFAIP